MKDKILYHHANARTYIFLAKTMRSSWYFEQARKELKQAQILLDKYEGNATITVELKLVA